MFFGLCSGSVVQLQVAPRRNAGSDADQTDSPSPQRKVDLIRLKPQPSQNGDSSVSGSKLFSLTAEDELFLFVNDIKFNNSHSTSNYSSASTALSCYTFEQSTFTPSSGLAIILRNYVTKHSRTSAATTPTQKATIPKGSFANQNFDSAPNFSSACKTFSLLLSSYVSNPDKGQTFQGAAGLKLKSIGAGLNSIENILIIVDIFLLAVIEHVNSDTTITRQDSTVLYELTKLYRTLVTYVLSAPPTTQQSNAYIASGVVNAMHVVPRIYAQIICKCAQIVDITRTQAFHNTLSTTSTSNTRSGVLQESMRTALEDCSQLTQINAEAISHLYVLVHRDTAERGMAGGGAGTGLFGYYYCTMLFWRVCSDLLVLLQRLSLSYALTRTNTYNDISLLYSTYDSVATTNNITTTTHHTSTTTTTSTTSKSTLVWQSLQFRVYNAMLSTAPTIEQLHYELYRIQNYRHNSNVFAEDTYCKTLLAQFTAQTAHNTQTTQAISSHNTIPTLPLPLTTYPPHNTHTVLSDVPRTFRLRFIFAGISQMFRAVDCIRPTRYSLPNALSAPAQSNQTKWLIALAEMLLSTLVKARSGGGGVGMNSMNSNNNSSSGGMLVFAPYLAEQILLRTSDREVQRCASTNWVYWDLAKSLGEFTYLLRRQLRSLQSHAALRHRGSGASLNMPSASASVRTMHLQGANEATERTNRANKTLSASASGPQLTSPPNPTNTNTGFDPNRSLKGYSNAHNRSLPPITQLANANINSGGVVAGAGAGANGMASTSALPEIKQNMNTEEIKPVFSVNDKVDGHCTLPNGSKRWYPGVIISAEYDLAKRQFLYTIRYNDGEERGHQTGNDIRFPKKRKPRTRASSATDDDSGYESTKYMHRASVDSQDESVNVSVDIDATLWAARHQMPINGTQHELRSSASSLGVANVASDESDVKSANVTLYRLQHQDSATAKVPPRSMGVRVESRPSLNLPGSSLPSSARGLQEIPEMEVPSLHSPVTVSAPVQSPPTFAFTSPQPQPQPLHRGTSEVEVEAEVVEYWDDAGDERGGSAGGTGAEEDAEDEEDGIFEIPRTFESAHRSISSANGMMNSSKKLKESLVPRIQFEDLDINSSFHHAASGGSLSGALLSEGSVLRLNNITNTGFHSFRGNGGDGTSRSNKAGMMSQMTSHRSYLENSMLSMSGDEHASGANFPFIVSPHTLMEEPTTGGNTRMLTWRGGEEATQLSGGTLAMSARMPSGQPSSAYSAAQDKVLRRPFGNMKGAFSDQVGVDESGGFVPPPVEFREYLGLGLGITDASVKLMMKTYSIICAVLIQRAVVHYDTPPVSSSTDLSPIGPHPTCLDYNTCTSYSENPSPIHPASGAFGAPNTDVSASNASYAGDGSNVLFNVREYLEILTDADSTLIGDGSAFSGFSGPQMGSSSPQSQSRLSTTRSSAPVMVTPAVVSTNESMQSTGVHEGLATLSLYHSEAALRLCKMLSSAYLKHSCLVRHMNSSDANGDRLAEKIGEGGFGTVFKLACDCASAGFIQYHNCLGCYKYAHRHTTTKSGAMRHACQCWETHCTPTPKKREFAIKRVPRERSMHDPSRLYDLYSEISAMELLRARGSIGACGLEDFGVVGSEYWLVMELGVLNLEEWRTGHASPRAGAAVVSQETHALAFGALSQKQIATCLLVFVDALHVLDAVHSADIAHFDVKCSNFVFRAPDSTSAEPHKRYSLRDSTTPLMDLAQMHSFHLAGVASGSLFLADFGEAVPHISHSQCSEQVRSRCRGTLHIQSPEMICISQTSTGTGTGTGTPVLTMPSSANTTFNNSVPASVPAYLRSAKNPRRAFSLPDARSDIWSMGCLLVELLAAVPLFAEKPWPELYSTLCMETFTSLDTLVPEALHEALGSASQEVRDEVVKVVRAALRQMPDDRPTLKTLIDMVNVLLSQSFSEFVMPVEEVSTAPPENTEQEIDLFPLSTVDVNSSNVTSLSDCVLPIGDSVFLSVGAAALSMTDSQRTQETVLNTVSEVDAQVGATSLSSVALRQVQNTLKTRAQTPSSANAVTLIVVRVHLDSHSTEVNKSNNTHTSSSANRASPSVACVDLHIGATDSLSALTVTVHSTVQQVQSLLQQGDKGTAVQVIVELEAPHHTSRLALSVATALCARLCDVKSNSTSGLSWVVKLWRAMPRLHALCSAELVHNLLFSASSK